MNFESIDWKDSKMKRFIFLIAFALLMSTAVYAQDAVAPPAIRGEAVYVPFPVAITLDGDLSDWAGIPTVTVDNGTMPSSNPAENGSFTFAVAADSHNFYIYMTMPDAIIITGQHDANYWNEDSLEFYLNLSGDLNAGSYTASIFQININPGDIGNTDASTITLTGSNSLTSGVNAIIFATDDGWGFEGSMALDGRIMPSHGLEIGFQAHANGASELDRKVKLIWSAADTADTSWTNPSVFGRALFFEVGSTEVPMPTPREVEPEVVIAPLEFVAVNQTGYFVDAPKFAVYSLEEAVDAQPSWSLHEVGTDVSVATGVAAESTLDTASGLYVNVIDFSSYRFPGRYYLSINGVNSQPFVIGNGIYHRLARDAARYFYLTRSGIELKPELAGEWARPAGHLTDNDVSCWAGTDSDGITWEGCDYRIDGSGGWYDAGDYGKYVVNGGISAWTLMNLYERFLSMFADDTLGIPESGNGNPDLLDESRWEMDFLMRMQVPEGQPFAGMAHHKLHDRRWSGVPVMVPTEFDNDDANNGRFVFPPSTAATLNLAATAAQCARIWAEIDPDYSAQCLESARRAWDAANANPAVFTGRTPGEGGGDYSDANVSDEFFWAAAELYVTTGEQVYLDFLTASTYFSTIVPIGSAMAWPDTAMLGVISLATVPNRLSAENLAVVRNNIISVAGINLTTIEQEGYRVPLTPNDYVWGSNSSVLNNAIVMALAYDFTADERYLHGTMEGMNYVLGRNANNLSFVSGYGENAAQHPHHRFWGNNPAQGFPPPPPGVVMGGPNGQPSDEDALDAGVMDFGASRRYVDLIGSYSTNEVAINWNAPLAWVAAYLDGVVGR
jgi:endoglucanase